MLIKIIIKIVIIIIIEGEIVQYANYIIHKYMCVYVCERERYGVSVRDWRDKTPSATQ